MTAASTVVRRGLSLTLVIPSISVSDTIYKSLTRQSMEDEHRLLAARHSDHSPQCRDAKEIADCPFGPSSHGIMSLGRSAEGENFRIHAVTRAGVLLNSRGGFPPPALQAGALPD